jgi:hypothetical protein
MIFRIIKHYNYLQDDDNIEMNDCLFCLEFYKSDKLAPINFKTQQLYLKNCNCVGWVHTSCLCEWHDLTKSCPICRLYMKKHTSILSNVVFKITNFGRSCLFFFKLFFRIFRKIIWIFIMILITYQVYFIYIKDFYDINDYCKIEDEDSKIQQY